MRKFINFCLCAFIVMALTNGCVLYKKLPSLRFSEESLLTIITHPSSNKGIPFYVLIREVEKATFLVDSYDDVAHKVLNSREAYPYIVSQVLIPGESYTFKQQRGEKGVLLGVYFFFTDGRQDWKVLVDPTFSKTTIDLQGGEIQVTESR